MAHGKMSSKLIARGFLSRSDRVFSIGGVSATMEKKHTLCALGVSSELRERAVRIQDLRLI
jgi:hypothetical protein